MVRACFRCLPSVTSPGRAGTVTVKPPRSFASKKRGVFADSVFALLHYLIVISSAFAHHFGTSFLKQHYKFLDVNFRLSDDWLYRLNGGRKIPHEKKRQQSTALEVASADHKQRTYHIAARTSLPSGCRAGCPGGIRDGRV